MKKALLVLSLFTPLLTLTWFPAHAEEDKISEAELVRRTQELLDAVPGGDSTPFRKYFADDVIFSDEKGRTLDKAALLKDVAPMPKGYSGHIKIAHVQSRILGDTAILSYDLDESETVFGQQLAARYHQTDTWMRRGGQWQTVAGQVLRYYEDPAAGHGDTSKYPGYAGSYELAPGITMTITVEGGHLYAQRGERAREELIPEAGDLFFRKGVEGRRLFRYGADGKVDALIDGRNNEDIVWKKIK